MVNPATVLYENWILYTYPVAVFLCSSALFFARYVRAHRSVDAVLFACAIAALALTRASYHLVFVLAAVAGLVLASGAGARRRAFVACAVPLLLVVGLYTKNLVLFGSPSASSWTGLNLGRMVFGFSNEGLVRRDMKSGQIWRYSIEPPFQAISVYTKRRPHTGIPALDDVYKSTGEPNPDNRENIAISNQYLSSALSFIRSHPLTYARLVGYSFQFAAAPAEDNPFLAKNRDAVEDLIGLYRVALLQPRDADVRHAYITRTSVSSVAPSADEFAWGVVLQYLVVFAAGPVLLVGMLRRKPSPDPSRRATLIYLSLVTIYGVTVSNLFELGENQRFRFETDPIVCVAATALATGAWLYLKTPTSRRARTTSDGDASSTDLLRSD